MYMNIERSYDTAQSSPKPLFSSRESLFCAHDASVVGHKITRHGLVPPGIRACVANSWSALEHVTIRLLSVHAGCHVRSTQLLRDRCSSPSLASPQSFQLSRSSCTFAVSTRRTLKRLRPECCSRGCGLEESILSVS
jgi:hypothetical protein